MWRARVWVGFALLAMALCGASFWRLQLTNRNERDLREWVLNLRAQTIGRHVNAWRPAYDASFQVYSGARYGRLVAVLYDLAGREVGRLPGTQPLLPLNEFAVRLVPQKLLRSRLGETPIVPFASRPPELEREPRPGNLCFSTNAIGSGWISELKTGSGSGWLVVTTPINDWDEGARVSFISAWLQVALPLDEVNRSARERTWWWAGFWLVGAGLFVTLFFWSTRQRRALRSVATAAERIQIERLATSRLPEPHDDPEGLRLVRACNRLLDRVAEIHAGQQRFMADAAHELRTPLTILRGEIQVCLREPGNQPLLIETLKSNLDESVHLSRLVESLLTLARADAGTVLGERLPVDLTDLVARVLDRMRPLAEGRRVRLTQRSECLPGECLAEIDAVALERVLVNLMDNAIKHSPADHVVEVRLSATGPQIFLKVTDHGMGIGAEHLPHLFNRFYRVDAARRRMDGGTGLGLAIVKTIVEAHGGTVSVTSEIGVGSTFTVSLPCKIKNS